MANEKNQKIKISKSEEEEEIMTKMDAVTLFLFCLCLPSLDVYSDIALSYGLINGEKDIEKIFEVSNKKKFDSYTKNYEISSICLTWNKFHYTDIYKTKSRRILGIHNAYIQIVVFYAFHH